MRKVLSSHRITPQRSWQRLSAPLASCMCHISTGEDGQRDLVFWLIFGSLTDNDVVRSFDIGNIVLFGHSNFLAVHL